MPRRVVFKLQAYDWKGEKWVSDGVIKEDITFLLSLGAQHVAYYPDNVHPRTSRTSTRCPSILSAKG